MIADWLIIMWLVLIYFRLDKLVSLAEKRRD